MFRYFTMFIALTLVGYLYEKYRNKQDSQDEFDKYDAVKKFLLNDKTLLSGKPILWIHNNYATNSRWWPSFFSRNTDYLNQPYLQLCIESIIKYCGESFNICLIDDDSFSKLLPDWKIDFRQLPDPIKSHIRNLAMCRTLYYYGGLRLPNSTLVLEDLKPIYKNNILEHDIFTFECINRNSSSTYTSFFPNIELMGCRKNSKTMKLLIRYLEELVSGDHTNEMDFLGQPDRWLFQKCEEGDMGLVPGTRIGTRSMYNRPVYVDDLLSKCYIPYNQNLLSAIFIPAKEILKRTKYEWFARMSRKQVLESDLILTKYILIAQASK